MGTCTRPGASLRPCCYDLYYEEKQQWKHKRQKTVDFCQTSIIIKKGKQRAANPDLPPCFLCLEDFMGKGKADLLLIAVTAFWGSSFILMKNVASDVSPFAYMALRFLVASVILAALFFHKLKRFNRRIMFYGLILGASLTLYMVLQMAGLRYTEASTSAFITSLSVLLVPFVSSAFLKKYPSLSNVIGVIFAFLGLFFITGGAQSTLNVGDMLTLVAAVFITIHIIMADIFTAREDGLLLGIAQVFFAAILSFAACLVIDPATIFSVRIDQNLLISVLLTGSLCTAFAFTAQVYAQQYVEPSRVAVIFMLEPVFALVYALFIAGPDGTTETLTFGKAAGALLVIAGTLFSELGLMEKIKNRMLDRKKK